MKYKIAVFPGDGVGPELIKEGRTRIQDLDGNNTTSEFGDAIADKFIELHD